jgi:hypothetical protein
VIKGLIAVLKDWRHMKLRAWVGVTALLGVGSFVIWTALKLVDAPSSEEAVLKLLVNAPSTEDAMQHSLKALEIPELEIAFALHPDACSIRKVNIWKWSAACDGVPMHFYQDITLCDPGPPKICGADPSSYTNCRSFYWDIDLDRKPSSPTGNGRKYASVVSDCMPKGMLASEQIEMTHRGLRPIPVEILDYAGWYTGKPRTIHPPAH